MSQKKASKLSYIAIGNNVEDFSDFTDSDKLLKEIEADSLIEVDKNKQLQKYDPKKEGDKLDSNLHFSKKFEPWDDAFDSDELDNSGSINLPSFLNNFGRKNKRDSQTENQGDTEQKDSSDKVNSIGSIFSSDHEQISGVRRVFKKSITFAVLQVFSFLLLNLLAVNFFTLNPLISLFFGVIFVAINNLFFIIVADRSYVYITLLAQFFISISVNAFFGLAFHPVTLILTTIAILFSYLAYLELEKVQLSSRLFSIAHITTESTRILLTAMILLLTMGIFNSIYNRGTADFVSDIILDNDVIVNNLFLNNSSRTSVNGYLVNGNFQYEDDQTLVEYFDIETQSFREAVIRDFLAENYTRTPVVSQERVREIESTCPTPSSLECQSIIKAERDEILKAWRDESYPQLTELGVDPDLDAKFTGFQYKQILKIYYSNMINNFETPIATDDGDVTATAEAETSTLFSADLQNRLDDFLIPRNTIIPAAIAIVAYLLISVFKFIFTWLSLGISTAVWSILRLGGFVRIEIETAESEIVSI